MKLLSQKELHKNKYRVSGNNEELSNIIPVQTAPYIMNNIVLTQLTFPIHKEILEPDYYTEVLDRIIGLQEEDVVIVSIDSQGGSVDGAMAIMQALEYTQAHVEVHVTGRAYSAASIIALKSPNLKVSPYARFMLHHATYGNFGKVSEIKNYHVFVEKQIEQIMREAYEGFLTEEEMVKLFDGYDYWFDNKEVMIRLDQRQEYFQLKEAQASKKPKTKKKTNSVE